MHIKSVRVLITLALMATMMACTAPTAPLPSSTPSINIGVLLTAVPLPTATITPTPWPAEIQPHYNDVEMVGILYQHDSALIFLGGSDELNAHGIGGTLYSVDPADETASEAIAALQLNIYPDRIVRVRGDIDLDFQTRQGRLNLRTVQPIPLPFDEDTPLANELPTVAGLILRYPPDWTVIHRPGGNGVCNFNPLVLRYSGRRAADPTAFCVTVDGPSPDGPKTLDEWRTTTRKDALRADQILIDGQMAIRYRLETYGRVEGVVIQTDTGLINVYALSGDAAMFDRIVAALKFAP
ncbi:MAG: hypothetical protein H5T64_05455 [Chloroflexi bacterium]|nr:hypothetical protein [Chloroflexota bacterium]